VGEEEVVGVSSSLLTAVKLATPESCCSGPVGPSNLLALDLSRDKKQDAETITGIYRRSLIICTPCNIIRVSISRRMDGWAHCSLEEMGYVQNFYFGDLKGRGQLEGQGYRQEDIIEMNLRERDGVGDTGSEWVQLQIFVNMRMNLRVP
jgi:hypothetical protein